MILNKIEIKIPQKKYYFFFFIVFIILDIYDYSNKYSLKEKILLRGRKYLIRCLKNKLNRKIYSEFINPKVAVVIPVYTIFNELKSITLFYKLPKYNKASYQFNSKSEND